MMGDDSDELGLSWKIPHPGVDREPIDRLRRKYDPRHLTAGERLELLSLFITTIRLSVIRVFLRSIPLRTFITSARI